MANPFTDWSSTSGWMPAPEDVILPRVLRTLAAAPFMQHFFGDAIEWVPDLDMPEFTRPPRFQIAYGAVPAEDADPTQIDRRDVRVIMRIRASWESWRPVISAADVQDYPDYIRPGLPTLEHSILQLLKDDADLYETINGQSVKLVSRGPRIGPFLAAGGTEDATAPTVWYRDAEVTYGIDLDRRTGKIRAIAAAGG